MPGTLELDFVELQAVPEIWFDEVARFELKDDGIVRLWLTTVEEHPEGRVRQVVLKLVTTVAGIQRNRERMMATMAAREREVAAVH